MGRPPRPELSGPGKRAAPRPDWAERLTDARAALGQTQESFAEKISRSQSAVTDWERGKREPDLATFQHLASNLGVSVVWLIHGVGPREPGDGDTIAIGLAERHKNKRYFGRALLRSARMLAEEGLDPDPLFLIRFATNIAREGEGAADQLEAWERIDRAIEIQRGKFREGLGHLTKNLL